MKTVDAYMQKIIEKQKGAVLAMDPTEAMYHALEINPQIIDCNVLSQNGEKASIVKRFKRRNKTFQFKKMRKIFKKKQTDFVIANIQIVESHFKTFIRDSIYITKNDIYLFIKEEAYDFELVMKRYQRFTKFVEIEKCKDGVILKIEVGSARNNWLKEKLYYIVDSVEDVIDKISDSLIS